MQRLIPHLKHQGYTPLRKDGPRQLWAKVQRTKNHVMGAGVILEGRTAIRVSAVADLGEAKIEALGQLLRDPSFCRMATKAGQAKVAAIRGAYLDTADEGDEGNEFDEIGGRRRRRGNRATRRRRRKLRRQGMRKALRLFGKRFRKKVNKAAKKIAKGKVIQKLRKAYVKVLKSPVAEAGVRLASRALQAYGVPPAVTRMALNARRHSKIDLMNKGGYAGMIERATRKKGGFKTMLREIGKRHVKSHLKALPSAMPGGAGNALKGVLKGVMTGNRKQTNNALQAAGKMALKKGTSRMAQRGGQAGSWLGKLAQAATGGVAPADNIGADPYALAWNQAFGYGMDYGSPNAEDYNEMIWPGYDDLGEVWEDEIVHGC